jgi:hypothetical protein
MERTSRTFGSAVICFVVVLLLAAGTSVTPAGQQRASLIPTPLEALAAQPDAKTAWSKFVGSLDGRTAYATVTAVAVESAASTPRMMRGVRIDLRHEGLRPSCDLKYVEWSVMCDRENAAAFVEESRLAEFRAAVLRGRAEVHAGHPMGVTDFRSSAPASGLLICGYALQDRRLEELAALLAKASTELQNAPR